MDLVPFIILWYLVITSIGCIFFPLTRKLFKFFPDQGYAFSKVIGILILSYSIYFLSSIRILAFTQLNLIVLLVIFGLINIKIYLHSKDKKLPINFIIVEEIMFLILLVIWAYIRSHEPSIRGLEKFMDFGFINSAIRTEYFPAKDMWLAGKNINYYYFGHLVGAVITKLSGIQSYISYNLILATLFALGISQAFSLGYNIAYTTFHKSKRLALIMASLTAFIMNFGGNLHTIYSLTNGYQNEHTQPFWELTAKFKFSDMFNIPLVLEKLSLGYWYPNATRFIPLTIHEFPLYSYVVADLHGHVFDIPFVLLTIMILYSYFALHKKVEELYEYIYPIFLGFLISVHYMTNAFDAPIYLLLIFCLSLWKHKFTKKFILENATIVLSFILFSLPFTLNFEPFATGIGVNCSPDFLVKIGKFGPFLFEKGNCQISSWWMLLTLWGFFWFNFIFLLIKTYRQKETLNRSAIFMVILFSFSSLLIIVPEFIYAKDIYPAHFRANTMFKLGYQAFIIMSLGSAFVFSSIKDSLKKDRKFGLLYLFLFIPLFALVAIYPTFAINSYYGSHPNNKVSLNGQAWIAEKYPEYLDISTYFNTYVKGQPVILEAQGDSYTDYNVVSAYTGLPTVAGWWVHEWLWRGSPDVVGKLIPDIQNIYESQDLTLTKDLIQKYHIEYVIIGSNEREKYKNIQVSKFEALGKAIYRSQNGKSSIYKISLDR